MVQPRKTKGALYMHDLKSFALNDESRIDTSRCELEKKNDAEPRCFSI